jgi:hypothetical protein
MGDVVLAAPAAWRTLPFPEPKEKQAENEERDGEKGKDR